MAKKEFNKWDKNCTTLETFYNDMLTRDPTEKCLRRGYWYKAQDLYEQYSVECNPIKCENLGKELGKIIGEAFCSGTVVNTTLSICNAREENSCGDAFFDYAFDNCQDNISTDNYTIFDSYRTHCQ
jgi:hypothetical protein